MISPCLVRTAGRVYSPAACIGAVLARGWLDAERSILIGASSSSSALDLHASAFLELGRMDSRCNTQLIATRRNTDTRLTANHGTS